MITGYDEIDGYPLEEWDCKFAILALSSLCLPPSQNVTRSDSST